MKVAQRKSSLKRGDIVMIIAGGNAQKRPNKGKTGKIVRFVGADRVIIEGQNFVSRHQRQTGPNKPSGKIPKEAPIHVSNVMYFAEKIKKPVRLKHKTLADGTKVRGYIDPSSKDFVQI